MSLIRFLEELRRGERVPVAPLLGADLEMIPAEEQRRVRDPLVDLDREVRLERPGRAPELSLPAARWGAETLYRGCQFLVCREVPAATIDTFLDRPAPGPGDATVTYSVDLTLHHLPDLLTMARSTGGRDPLVAALRRLARRWPLSSVGAGDLTGDGPGLDVTAILEDASLRLLYADRIIARRDGSRLDDPRVRLLVEAAVGGHRREPEGAVLGE